MKLSLRIAELLVRLIDGESIPYSSAKSKLIEDLVAENILFKKGKQRKTIKLIDEKALHLYLANQLQIHNLNEYISALKDQDASRADFVKISSDSKQSKERVFKGFLINSYTEINAELNGEKILIQPALGSFTFIYDYETFKIPEKVTLVGVENANNFRYIQEQKYLFKNIFPLFISRYPQNQHKDLIKWMTTIPNKYLHFGDFDIAGIGVYLNEYKCHLKDKASFFIPENIKKDIRKYGNRKRFNVQKANFGTEKIKEPELLDLIRTINTEKKGLDQEFYIKET